MEDVMVGDELELRGPIGGWFVWRCEQMEPIQLVAGGSGIVPLMAHDSLASFGRQQFAISVAIFRHREVDVEMVGGLAAAAESLVRAAEDIGCLARG
jgi:ferredoxin-NADP reductase